MTQYLSQWALLRLLWYAAWLGVLLGAIYSLFLIRRAAFERLHIPRILGAILLHAEDFVICMTGGVLLSVLYFAVTDGVLRLMALPALGMGLCLWRITAGRLIAACTDRILQGLARLGRFIGRRFLFPIGRWMGRVAGRLQGRWRAVCLRRKNRRLERQARAQTLRYRKALTAALAKGTLPSPHRGKKASKEGKK